MEHHPLCVLDNGIMRRLSVANFVEAAVIVDGSARPGGAYCP
jgi:hypothetical protein